MWRLMCQTDINAIYQISLLQWGSTHYESIDIFRDKYDFYSSGCFVYEKDNTVQGYIISHPWSDKIIPKLNERLDVVEINTYYIHDIVISPHLRGYGLSNEIIMNIIDNKKSVCLVAISFDVQNYWEKFGFEKTEIQCDYGVHMKFTPLNV